jgi:hypothetical protein
MAPRPAWAQQPQRKPAKEKMGTVVWKVAPANVIIFVDGKKIGSASKVKTTKVRPGQHLIRLVWNKDVVEEPISVGAGETREFQYTLEDSGTAPPP